MQQNILKGISILYISIRDHDFIAINTIESKLAPALQAAESALHRAQLETQIAKNLTERPTKDDLVQQNIMKGMFKSYLYVFGRASSMLMGH